MNSVIVRFKEHMASASNTERGIIRYFFFPPKETGRQMPPGRFIFLQAAFRPDRSGSAADDAHAVSWDAFGGFIMVRAESLTQEAVSSAILAGDYYSSEGRDGCR